MGASSPDADATCSPIRATPSLRSRRGELAGEPDGVQQLLSWNLHLSLRRVPVTADGPLMGSDIVYLEPPLP